VSFEHVTFSYPQRAAGAGGPHLHSRTRQTAPSSAAPQWQDDTAHLIRDSLTPRRRHRRQRRRCARLRQETLWLRSDWYTGGYSSRARWFQLRFGRPERRRATLAGVGDRPGSDFVSAMSGMLEARSTRAAPTSRGPAPATLDRRALVKARVFTSSTTASRLDAATDARLRAP